MGFTSKKHQRRVKNGSKGGISGGGSENAKAGRRNAAKVANGKKAALGEFGASMTQRFSRRAPPGEQATKEGAATKEGTAVPLPTCVGERPTEEGAPAQLDAQVAADGDKRAGEAAERAHAEAAAKQEAEEVANKDT